MLNYNKIHSAINFDRSSKRSIANYIGIGESTFRSRLERKNLTPDDVEKIAEFFNKPIAYFFDKEETIDTNDLESKDYKCQDCITKQKEIDELKEYRRKYIECLEELSGKKKAG